MLRVIAHCVCLRGLMGVLGLGILLISNALQANMAAPQYPLSGGFDLRFVGPALGLKYLQMQRELVTIQLYDGWAAVKGTYYIRNLSNLTIETRLGYPEFGTYTYYTPDNQNGQDWYASYIRVEDQLRDVRVRLDDQWMFVRRMDAETESPPASLSALAGPENPTPAAWYTFDAVIPAQKTVPLTVYYWVPTWGSFRSGYNSEKANGFLYLVETGAAWDGPIGQGRIAVALPPKGGLSQLMAFLSDLNFYVKDGLAVADFSELVPSRAHNLLLKYRTDLSQAIDSVDIEAAYAALDSLSARVEFLDLGSWTDLISVPGSLTDVESSLELEFAPEPFWKRTLSQIKAHLKQHHRHWIMFFVLLVMSLIIWIGYRHKKRNMS